MKLSIFGRKTIEVSRVDGQWLIFTLGEGTRVKSNDIVIPEHLTEKEMLVFLGDIFHEAASREHPEIKVIE